MTHTLISRPVRNGALRIATVRRTPRQLCEAILTDLQNGLVLTPETATRRYRIQRHTFLARITDLRRDGWNIVRRERVTDGGRRTDTYELNTPHHSSNPM